MVLDVKTLLELIKVNTDKYGMPLPMSRDALSEWTQGLDIPRRGEYMIFTGALYQALPYIEALYEGLRRVEDRGFGGFALKFASKLAKAVDFSRIIAKPKPELRRVSQDILRGIYKLLRAAGIQAYYVPEADGYSGALLYDMGLEKSFAEYAARVYRRLKEHGVKRVVTLDPHTTHMLRSIYPRYVDGYDVEVKSYLELLADNISKLSFKANEKVRVVIHDPCLYARFEDVIEQPRQLLAAAGYEVVEPRRSRRLTYCCGGPVESLAPSLSEAIARRRMEELASYANTIVTLCPICFLNLRRVAPNNVRVADIALLLVERLKA